MRSKRCQKRSKLYFSSAAPSKRYSKLKNTLKEDYGKGHDNYPTTLPQALNLLNIHESTLPRQYGRADKQDKGLAFLQTGSKEETKKTGKCFHCDQPGHWKRECPLKKYEAGVANINIEDEDEDIEEVEQAVGFIQCAFVQRFGRELNPNHIYLATCATFSQVIKEEFLQDIQPAETGLIAHCNAGKTYMDRFGFLGRLKVWHNALGLANIVFFHELEQYYNISYGTKSTAGSFIGDVIFRRNDMGLPYLDFEKIMKAIPKRK